MAAQVYECSVCGDEITEQRQVRLIDNDPICYECVHEHIVTQFEAAANCEHFWPVRWGRGIVHPKDFEAELSPEFIARYQRREHEYKAAPKLRVHCRHKILATQAPPAKGLPALSDQPGQVRAALRPWRIQYDTRNGVPLVDCGAMVTLRSTEHTAELENLPECWSCKGRVYPCSGEAAWDSQLEPHRCSENDESAAFITDDMVRGRDYQECPDVNCGRVILLRDGCNHVVCICRVGFCFICGEAHEGEDDHWAVGKPCPRYHKPGDSNAIFDTILIGEEIPPQVLQREAEQRAANEAALLARGRA